MNYKGMEYGRGVATVQDLFISASSDVQSKYQIYEYPNGDVSGHDVMLDRNSSS